MSPIRRHRLTALLVCAVAAVTAVSGCSSSGSGSTSSSKAAAGATRSAACSGDPVKVTLVQSLSGPASFPGVDEDTRDGVKAAVTAVNATCSGGRPLQVTVCDDKSDPNQSTTCGRTAKSDKSLALISTGTFENAAQAAGLPGLLTVGTTNFDATNPDSYPAESPIIDVLGTLTAAKAAGATSYTMVAFQSAQTEFIVSTAQAVGKSLGIPVKPLFFPADTTDFAPIAAQVAQAKPSAIGMIAPAIVPLINAFAGQGISPTKTPMFTAVTLVPPSVLKQLGSKADGLYLVSGQVPASDTTNAGIKQLLAEYKAAGISTKPDDIGTWAVDWWSKVHILADAIGKLSPAKVKTLDSAGLVAAVKALGTVDRPEFAPFNLGKAAFGSDLPPLAKFRIFTREVLVVHVENGQYKVVAPFGDVTKPFTLSAS